MNKILLFIFIIITAFVKGQSCNPTTFPTDIYYPNSSTTPTNNFGYEYLCGPNTIVYDTIEYGCHFVYVNSGCTLFFKPTVSCAAASYIWLKNNSVLNLVQGIGPVFIFHEASAIINNPYSVTVSSFSCASIFFPIVNCSVTGLKGNNLGNNVFETYPNPANDKLNIQFAFDKSEITKIQIINSAGQVIKEEELNYVNKQSAIDIKNIPNGMYLLTLKSDNSISISKRFVIAR